MGPTGMTFRRTLGDAPFSSWGVRNPRAGEGGRGAKIPNGTATVGGIRPPLMEM